MGRKGFLAPIVGRERFAALAKPVVADHEALIEFFCEVVGVQSLLIQGDGLRPLLPRFTGSAQQAYRTEKFRPQPFARGQRPLGFFCS